MRHHNVLQCWHMLTTHVRLVTYILSTNLHDGPPLWLSSHAVTQPQWDRTLRARQLHISLASRLPWWVLLLSSWESWGEPFAVHLSGQSPVYVLEYRSVHTYFKHIWFRLLDVVSEQKQKGSPFLASWSGKHQRKSCWVNIFLGCRIGFFLPEVASESWDLAMLFTRKWNTGNASLGRVPVNIFTILCHCNGRFYPSSPRWRSAVSRGTGC